VRGDRSPASVGVACAVFLGLRVEAACRNRCWQRHPFEPLGLPVRDDGRGDPLPPGPRRRSGLGVSGIPRPGRPAARSHGRSNTSPWRSASTTKSLNFILVALVERAELHDHLLLDLPEDARLGPLLNASTARTSPLVRVGGLWAPSRDSLSPPAPPSARHRDEAAGGLDKVEGGARRP